MRTATKATKVVGYKHRFKGVCIVVNWQEGNRHLVGYNGVVFLFNDGVKKMESGAKLYMNQGSVIVPMTSQCVDLAEESVCIRHLDFSAMSLWHVASCNVYWCAVCSFWTLFSTPAHFGCVRLAEIVLLRSGYLNVVWAFGVKFRQSALQIKPCVTHRTNMRNSIH
jgi:hypothetical protein